MRLDQGDLLTEPERSGELASLTTLTMLCLVSYFLVAFSLFSRVESVSYSSVRHPGSSVVWHIAGAQAVLMLFWISWT